MIGGVNVTAIMAICLNDGVFLAADSIRTDLVNFSTQQVKKIVKLTDSIFIFSGGLGDYADYVKNVLVSNVTDRHGIYDVINHARPLLQHQYNKSIQEHGKHDERLTFCVAGIDPNTKQGKILIVQDNSENFWNTKVITPDSSPLYLASNTKRFTEIGTSLYAEKATQMDEFAYESIRIMSNEDQMVGFPLQMVLLRNEKSPIEKRVEEAGQFQVDPQFTM